MAPEYSVNEARNQTYRFLEAQRDKTVTRGGGWAARELTRLLVHFWESGKNAKAVLMDEYPPVGVTVINQDDEPVFWGGVNWWSAHLHEWRTVIVTSWHYDVQSSQSTAVDVDGQ